MALDNTVTTITGDKLSIVGGKWTKRVSEDTEGAVARQLTKGKNEGKTVWEIGYASVSGHLISGVLSKNNVLGLAADIVLIDYETKEQYNISLGADSKFLKEIIKRLPNLDMEKEVKLELVVNTRKKTKTGGTVYKIHIIQDGRFVEDHYVEWKTGENGYYAEMKHGMPEAVETRTGWDFKAQDEFLFTKFDEFFGDYTPPPHAVDSPVVETGDVSNEIPEEFDDGTSVPF